MFRLKRKGFSDARLGQLLGQSEAALRAHRKSLGIKPVFKRVDTCAAEFPSATAYLYSTYEEECEAAPTDRRKIMVLGGGPNRIGQGIEFDYCCVHAALAMREDGYETIMVNCNPETVSTDYDTSDRLYFEPVTLEDVLAIVEVERPTGVIVQFGGQTPLKLVDALQAEGVPIIGTSADAIDQAEDRQRFQQMITKVGLLQPENRTVATVEAGIEAADTIGFPMVVRPSYVLGGRAMEVVHNKTDLARYLRDAFVVSNSSPVLLDHFLDQAIEIDVDAVCDGDQVVIGAIMQHIEQAGVHSGDSACSLPPYRLAQGIQDQIRRQVKAMALELGVIGLMNVQMAVQQDRVFVLEVNPRASRTVPFVSKCIGVSLAKIAARCMAGTSLAAQGFTSEIIPHYVSVKESVFPFNKFPGADPILGPEMKSTGEVMGVGDEFRRSVREGDARERRAAAARWSRVPQREESDKLGVADLGRDLVDLGFELVATRGTARVLTEAGVPVEVVNKVTEGRPGHRRPSEEREDRFDREYHRRPASHRGLGGDSAARVAEQSLLHHHLGGWRGLRHCDSIRSRQRGSPVAGPSREHRAMKVPMTLEGSERLREELTHLKSVLRPQIIKAIATAREHGDLKENAEYHAAKEQQGFAEGRIKEIEGKLADAQIIDVTKIKHTGKVVFGSTVTLVEVESCGEKRYKIVGEDEADLKQNKISVMSPIARALVGKSEGDTVAVKAPNGSIEYEIDKVEHI